MKTMFGERFELSVLDIIFLWCYANLTSHRKSNIIVQIADTMFLEVC